MFTLETLPPSCSAFLTGKYLFIFNVKLAMYVVNYYDETRKKIKTFSNSSLLKNLLSNLVVGFFEAGHPK